MRPPAPAAYQKHKVSAQSRENLHREFILRHYSWILISRSMQPYVLYWSAGAEHRDGEILLSLLRSPIPLEAC